MKIGKNDPCPCASGKKYKKCCIDKETKLEELLESEELPEFDEFLDIDEEETNQEWKLFQESDYEAKIAWITKSIDDEAGPDPDSIFDMLSEIQAEIIQRGERKRFDDLLQKLSRQWPDVYGQDASWYCKWQIQNALVEGRTEALTSLTSAMAKTAGGGIDEFNEVLDMLAYYGEFKMLLDAMQTAWPYVKDSDEILPYGIGEFDERRVDYIVFDYLENHGSLDASDKKLLKSLGVLDRINTGRLARAIELMSQGASWTLDDFSPKSKNKNEVIAAKQRLCDLTIEFSGYLRRTENISYPKGEMARTEILNYLFEREEGDLDPEEGMFEATIREAERRPKPKLKPMEPTHPLCPDSQTLECYLTGLLHFANPQEYKAAALFELFPSWLRFLKIKNLINGDVEEKVLTDLESLIPDLNKIWQKHPEDPSFLKALKQWRALAEKQMAFANAQEKS